MPEINTLEVEIPNKYYLDLLKELSESEYQELVITSESKHKRLLLSIVDII